MNTQNVDLETPLNARRESDFIKVFAVRKTELCDFFDPDNIHRGISVEKLGKMGGTEGLLEKLKVSAKTGVNSDDQSDLDSRFMEFGRNDPIVKEPPTIWEMITEQFEDKMLRLLCIASIVSILIGIMEEGIAEGWYDGGAILLAVCIIVSVTTFNNYMKEKQFRKLNTERENRTVSVRRKGEVIPVSIYDLYVGDIVEFTSGEQYPVDGVLLRGNNISVDEGAITGESHEIKKTVPTHYTKAENANPFLLAGSKCMEGAGEMVVCAVGVLSTIGKNKTKLQEEEGQTILQRKLIRVSDGIGVLGQWSAGLTVAVLTIFEILHVIGSDGFGGLFSLLFIQKLLDFLIIGVTIIVVAIPEGLPLAVTIALAYSVNKMKDENNLVRLLQSCETMGGANNICTDKTGTLTQNKMEVVQMWIEGSVHQPIIPDNISKSTRQLFSESVCINSNAFPQKVDGKWEQRGNKTECALLELASAFGVEYPKYRNSDNCLRVAPFSSATKTMSTYWKLDNKNIRVHVKGASEVILEKSSHYIDASGSTKKLDESTRQHISKAAITSFANKSLRTIGIAYKDIQLEDLSQLEHLDLSLIERDLIFIAVGGIADPLRPEVKKAVKICKDAGITIRMVTGDNVLTATAIAKDCGILPPDPDINEKSFNVMEGKQFREYVGGLEVIPDPQNPQKEIKRVRDMVRFKEVADELRVLARSTPDDKYLLVTGLKALENVVAVTGDGTNDAPALKKADVGFAMGIAGTEVAKEAAGIIILDDNFNSIVTAVKWGRNIYDSIRKFLQFQLTVNMVALFMVFVGSVVLHESPLNPKQMLWVNLIMDTLASLALATEPPSEELLKRKPYPRNEYMITGQMWRNIFGQSAFQIIVLSIVLFFGDELFDVPSSVGNHPWTEEGGQHYTIFFNVFVFLQLFNEINCRKLGRTEYNVFENFFNNPMFIFVIIATFVVQWILVQLGGVLMHCSPLDFDVFLQCAVIGALGLVVSLAIKKFVPETMFETYRLFDDTPVTDEEILVSKVSTLRKPSAVKKLTR